MNSLFLAVSGLVLFGIGYRYYASYLANKVFSINQFSGSVPAKEFEDGIDYVPTPKNILLGHHFTSVAGAAPIIGPCIAVYWGWLPAFLWVVFGAIFFGAVHDFGTLVISVKEQGKTIADITGSIINKRVKIIFLLFVMILSWLVMAVFSMAIAGLFVNMPTAVLPINIEIFVSVLAGILIHKKKLNALKLSIIGLVILYISVYVGTYTPISFDGYKIEKSSQITIWIFLLFFYSAIASLLPVWVLLQPRDYLNSHQLIVGLFLIYAGIVVAQPNIEAPMVRSVEEGGKSLFPLLFVTIACGAISGFHGLIASGTTSKQISNIKHTKIIGYGSMLGEATLALASIIAAVAGISLVGKCNLPSIGHVENLSWNIYYDTWGHTATNKATAFVLGGGALIESLGVSAELAKTITAVLVISFASTTLDTATRVQRFILTEVGVSLNNKVLKNRYFSTLVAIIPALFLTLWNVTDPITGSKIKAGWALWPIFGASNQMLAALILMMMSIYFWEKKNPITPLIIPFVFITITTFISLIINANSFIKNNLLLFTIEIIFIILITWMLYEGFNRYRKIKLKIKKESK